MSSRLASSRASVVLPVDSVPTIATLRTRFAYTRGSSQARCSYTSSRIVVPLIGTQLSGLVDDDVLGGHESREALVLRLARKNAIEVAEGRKAGRVELGVPRVVAVVGLTTRIGKRDDGFDIGVEIGDPPPPRLDGHLGVLAGGRAVVDGHRQRVRLRERPLDDELVTAVKRHELPEDEPSRHNVLAGAVTAAIRPSTSTGIELSRFSSRTHWNHPATLIAW